MSTTKAGWVSFSICVGCNLSLDDWVLFPTWARNFKLYTGPALSSVNGESYAQENGVKICTLIKGIIIQLNRDQLGSRYWPLKSCKSIGCTVHLHICIREVSDILYCKTILGTKVLKTNFTYKKRSTGKGLWGGDPPCTNIIIIK
jgi:hypothetical protein